MSIGNYITKDKVYPSISAADGVYNLREQARHKREGQWPSGSVATVTWSASSYQAAVQSSYTFPLNFTSAPNNCLILVHSFHNGAVQQPTSVTLGGTALTHIGGISSSGTTVRVDMYFGSYSDPITSVVIDYPSAQENVGIGSYIIYNATATPYDTASGISTSGISVNIATRPAGLVVAASLDINGAASSWTGVSEDYETDIRSGEYMSGGHIEGVASNPSYTVARQDARVLFAASW